MHIAPEIVKRERKAFIVAWLPVNGRPRKYKVEGGSIRERFDLIYLLHEIDELIAEYCQEMQA